MIQPLRDQLYSSLVVAPVQDAQVLRLGAQIDTGGAGVSFGCVSARVVKYPDARSADSSRISPVPYNCDAFASKGRSPFQK
jgi:hypothetical protein